MTYYLLQERGKNRCHYWHTVELYLKFSEANSAYKMHSKTWPMIDHRIIKLKQIGKPLRSCKGVAV